MPKLSRPLLQESPMNQSDPSRLKIQMKPSFSILGEISLLPTRRTLPEILMRPSISKTGETMLSSASRDHWRNLRGLSRPNLIILLALKVKQLLHIGLHSSHHDILATSPSVGRSLTKDKVTIADLSPVRSLRGIHKIVISSRKEEISAISSLLLSQLTESTRMSSVSGQSIISGPVQQSQEEVPRWKEHQATSSRPDSAQHSR
jgi:hypothetical protein